MQRLRTHQEGGANAEKSALVRLHTSSSNLSLNIDAALHHSNLSGRLPEKSRGGSTQGHDDSIPPSKLLLNGTNNNNKNSQRTMIQEPNTGKLTEHTGKSELSSKKRSEDHAKKSHRSEENALGDKGQVRI